MTEINKALGIEGTADCPNGNNAFEESAFKCFSGRATRSAWWEIRIVVFPFACALGLALSLLLCRDSNVFTVADSVTLTAFASFLGLAIGLICIPIDVKRLHDRNMSGWWVLAWNLLSFVPVLGWVAGVFFFINLGCLDGTIGSNRYGEDPKGRKGNGGAGLISINEAIEVRLQRIKELCDKGILSDVEYAEQRKRIIAEL